MMKARFAKPLAAIKRAVTWAVSPTGRKDLGALVAAATAVYTALHRVGVTP